MSLPHRLILLSLAAGSVDAIAFVHAGVFPANMTGNSVVLALALAHVNVGGLALPAVALAGFVAGAAIGGLLSRGEPAGWSRRKGRSVGVSAALLLAGTGLVLTGGGLFSSVVLAAAAMGLQSVIAQRIGVAGIATVVVTGTLTTAVTRLMDRNSATAPAHRHLPAGSWLAYFGGAVLGGVQSAPHGGALILLPGLLLAAAALVPSREN